MESIGNRLQKIIKKTGNTNASIAEMTGKSGTTIGNYVKDITPIPADVLETLKAELGISIDQLIFGHEQYKDQIESDLIEIFKELNQENRDLVMQKAAGLLYVQQKKD